MEEEASPAMDSANTAAAVLISRPVWASPSTTAPVWSPVAV